MLLDADTPIRFIDYAASPLMPPLMLMISLPLRAPPCRLLILRRAMIRQAMIICQISADFFAACFFAIFSPLFRCLFRYAFFTAAITLDVCY